MKNLAVVTFLCAIAVALSAVAQSGEFVTYESTKYGYSIKIPKEFKMEGKEDKTTTWSFQPGSAPTVAAPSAEAPSGGKKKGKGLKALGGLVKDVAGSAVKDATPSAPGAGASSGGLEPAVGIYINWVWMPDVSSGTMFSTNKKSDEQNIKSPDPDYKDLEVLDKKKGYAFEGGQAYRMKEVDKKDPAEIHRWHIKAYGNKSAYTLGFTGTYKQFEKWGPIFEQSMKSFKLIPMKESK